MCTLCDFDRVLKNLHIIGKGGKKSVKKRTYTKKRGNA